MYCTHVNISEKISVDLFTDNMFRLRKSEMEFDEKYNIPFVIGHINDWDTVNYSVQQKDNNTYIITKSIEIIVTDDGDFMVNKNGGQLYPSDEPVYGFIKNNCMVFDSASAVYEISKNNRYAHWFYNPQTNPDNLFASIAFV